MRPILGHRAFTLALLGTLSTWGCSRLQSTPPPPTEAQIDAMRRQQAVTEARADAVQAEIDAIRSRRDSDRASRSPVVPSNREWTLEQTVLDALGRIGSAAVPDLVHALEDPRPEIRLQAARVLARIGPAANEAVPALILRLQDVDPEVRKSAVRALGQIGPAAEPAVPTLFDMLK